MSDPVLTACHCPGTPHDKDEFHLADELPIEAGIAAATALQMSDGTNSAATLIGAVLRNGGIRRWNLVDEEGDDLPLNPANVAARVSWLKGGVELASAAIERYVNAKGAPFGLTNSARRNGTSSQRGRTTGSTSRKTPSSLPPPEPSE